VGRSSGVLPVVVFGVSPIFYPADTLRNKIAAKEIVTRLAEKQNAADDHTKAITSTMSKRQDDGNVSYWIET